MLTLACAEVCHSYILTTTIFNIYSGGCIYLSILCIVLKETLLCTKSLSSTFLKLALQAFYQAKSVTILALNLLTLVQLNVFLYQRQLFYTVTCVISRKQLPDLSSLRGCNYMKGLNEDVKLRLEFLPQNMSCFSLVYFSIPHSFQDAAVQPHRL